jgi:hypothetical protein
VCAISSTLRDAAKSQMHLVACLTPALASYSDDESIYGDIMILLSHLADRPELSLMEVYESE